MPDGGPAFSVVIPAHGCGASIARTVALVADQVVETGLGTGRSGEIVVVDDCSTDDTARQAEAALHACPVPGRVVRRTVRGGPNAARNAGVLASTGPVLVFIDGDDEPLPGWLDALLGAVDDDSVVGGSYLISNGRSAPALAPAASRRAFGFAYAVGGCMAVSRLLLDAVGGFDENITRGGSEVEFSIEAQLRHGATVVAVPEATVLHRVPGSMWGQARTHFSRERGHQYIERRLRRLREGGLELPARSTAPDAPATATASRRGKARAAGGWRLLAAEMGGRAVGRVVFGVAAWNRDADRRGR